MKTERHDPLAGINEYASVQFSAAPIAVGLSENTPQTQTQTDTQTMQVEIKNNELVIRMPLQTPEASKSGKTLVIATTRGNVRTSTLHNGKPVTVGLNAYIPH